MAFLITSLTYLTGGVVTIRVGVFTLKNRLSRLAIEGRISKFQNALHKQCSEHDSLSIIK